MNMKGAGAEELGWSGLPLYTPKEIKKNDQFRSARRYPPPLEIVGDGLGWAVMGASKTRPW